MSELMQIRRQTVCDIADAIRELTGSTDKIKGCDFDDKIKEYASGGGEFDAWLQGAITEITSDLTEVRKYACHYLEGLKEVNLPNATKVHTYAFAHCSNLTTVNIPKVTNIYAYAFQSCTSLTEISLPSVTSMTGSPFDTCTQLTTVDTSVLESLQANTFKACSALKSLILRKTDDIVNALSTTCLADTLIASGTGYIYVPSALVDTYTSVPSWSTYAAQFRALEDYTVDGTITGALDETKI